MEKQKYGWTVWGIISFVFIPIGLIFLPIGLGLWYAKAGNDPEDPIIFLVVFGGIGALFLIIGLAFLAVDLRRRARMRRAYEGGYYVMAKIADIKVNTSINGVHGSPWVVECHYNDPDTGETHIWYSRNLYMNVKDLLTSDEVPVYIDRYDKRIAYVDVDAVLPKISVHR